MISYVTAFIAGVVAVIALLQWQTARAKVLLDLFDKRFAVYDELYAVLPAVEMLRPAKVVFVPISISYFPHPAGR